MPSLGRFLTRDTWDGNANSPMSFNRWNYTEGNPINYTDPTGNSPCGPGCIDIIREKIREALRLDRFTSILGECGNGEVIDYEFVGMFNLSGYYTPGESDSFWTGSNIPILAHPNQHKYGKYLSQDGKYTNNIRYAQTAKKDFLNDRSNGVCMQGSGKLKDGRIIHCSSSQSVFEWGSSSTSIARVLAFETVAVRKSGKLKQNDTIYINAPWFKDFMAFYSHDAVLKVTDYGGGLATNTIDVYLGIGESARLIWANEFNPRDSSTRPTMYWPVYRITKKQHNPQ